MTEDQLEQQCLEWFAECGWETAHGPDLAPDGAAPERADYRQVLLLADLEAALRRINPHLPQRRRSLRYPAGEARHHPRHVCQRLTGGRV